MSLIGKIVKYTGFFGIGVVTLISSYFIALAGMCILMSAVCAVWSFIQPLPQYIAEHYGVLLLQSSIPLGIVIAVYVIIHAYKKK